jgi:uncharacterized protein YndB with AHSA1/START domain
MTNNNAPGSTADREIVMTRTVNAPRELVYKVWTEPEHIAKWWGPNGFTNTVHEMHVRQGGTWRYIMHGPDGTNYPNRIVYTEVVPQEKLVYLHGDDIDNDPNAFHVTITFEAEGNKTKVTMHSVFASADLLQMLTREYGVLEGAVQNMNRLEAYLVGIAEDSQLLITREFNAPRELVYKVWTEAEHLAKWWGAKGASIEVAKFDLKPGGLFHYCMKTPDGKTMWAKFVYREIIAPEKLVFVNSFSDEAGGTTGNPWLPVWPLEILNVLTLMENGDKTTLVLKGGPINASEAEIEAFKRMKQGMQHGFAGAFQQLDEYLAAMDKK